MVGRDVVTGAALRQPSRPPSCMNAWIGIGGNFTDTEALIKQALMQLDSHPAVTVLRVSGIYRSPPWGMTGQADFVNAVAELESGLSAGDLLDFLLEIEGRLGRTRSGPRWGPRCIDLDLLTYQNLTVKTEQLELPHPRMHLRAFVLVPLLELEPGFEIPGIGTARNALERLEEKDRADVQLFSRVNQDIEP